MESKQTNTEDYAENDSVKQFIQNLLQRSSIGGVQRLGSDHSNVRRIFWLSILILLVVGCGIQCFNFLTAYYSYPVLINLDVENAWRSNFPAVTICNINSARYSNLDEMCSTTENFYDVCHLFPFPNQQANLTDEKDSILRPIPSQLEALNPKLAFQRAFASVPEYDRIDIGHQFDNFIKLCTFNGDICDSRDFTPFSSLTLGNCFTFNKQNSDQTLTTQSVGIETGLLLEFNIEDDEYIPITEDLGVRVSVHEPDSLPLPEDEGFNVSPGFETNIGIKKTVVERLPHPYKDQCLDYKFNETNSRSQEDCFRKCLQDYTIKCCQCTNPFFRRKHEEPICDFQNETHVKCLENVELLLKNRTNFECECHLPCRKIYYDSELSTIYWPSEIAFKEKANTDFPEYMEHRVPFEKPVEIQDNVQQTYEEFDKQRTIMELRKEQYLQAQIEALRRNQGKVRIFFKTLETTTYKQVPMFQDSEVFSQMGGQLGLWIGVSIIALFECIEGSILLAQFIMRRRSKRRYRDRKMAEQEENEIQCELEKF